MFHLHSRPPFSDVTGVFSGSSAVEQHVSPTQTAARWLLVRRTVHPCLLGPSSDDLGRAREPWAEDGAEETNRVGGCF